MDEKKDEPVTVIKPTVGRKVYFRVSTGLGHGMSIYDHDQPCDATVTYVHSDRMVNVLVVDHMGNLHPRTSVQFVQPGDTPPSAHGGYVEWMPYQVGQAKAAS